MKAKEMFEELGFKQTTCTNEQWSEHAHVEYEAIDSSGLIKRKIIFLPKGFYAQLYHNLGETGFELVGGCIVGDKMLQAITQQMKELGWLDE